MSLFKYAAFEREFSQIATEMHNNRPPAGKPSRGEPTHIRYGSAHYGEGKHGAHVALRQPGGKFHAYADRVYVGDSKSGKTHELTDTERIQIAALLLRHHQTKQLLPAKKEPGDPKPKA